MQDLITDIKGLSLIGFIFILAFILIILICKTFYHQRFNIKNKIFNRDFLFKNFDKKNYLRNFKFILIIDIDNFSSINENYGYEKGDEVLFIFSSLLQEFFSQRDQIFRYGGDEFIIFTKKMSTAVIKECFSEINKSLSIKFVTSKISFSMVIFEINNPQIKPVKYHIYNMLNELAHKKKYNKKIIIEYSDDERKS